jgi:poly-gamma-glutamate synthesis protein (capsule biosynthesis protein)
LGGAGIAVLRHGSIIDLGPFRLAALSDLDNYNNRAEGLIAPEDIAALSHSNARPPVFAIVNWGTDYVAAPQQRQLDLREALRQAAISLIVGVHPHIAKPGLDLLAGGEGLSAYSLGNFIFDQDARIAETGAILEVRVFDQGTYFARIVTHKNLFQRALDGERRR